MFIKIGVETIPPLTVAGGRLVIAAALLVVYALSTGARIPGDARSWGAFLFIGFFGNALPFSLISFGEQFIDSMLAAILMGVMPLATVLLAHLFVPEEPFTRRRGWGIACGFSGLVILVGWQALAGLGAAVVAQLAVLGGAISYAITTVFTRRYVRLPGRVMAAGATLTGALWVAPLALYFEQPWQLAPTLKSVAAVIELGLLPTALATLIYFRLVPAVGATAFAQINYLVPIFGVGWGTLFLAEQPSWRALCALLLVLIGIALVNRAPSANDARRGDALHGRQN